MWTAGSDRNSTYVTGRGRVTILSYFVTNYKYCLVHDPFLRYVLYVLHFKITFNPLYMCFIFGDKLKHYLKFQKLLRSTVLMTTSRD